MEEIERVATGRSTRCYVHDGFAKFHGVNEEEAGHIEGNFKWQWFQDGSVAKYGARLAAAGSR